ncbi:MAG: HAMP domain-containing protein [Candidatus Hydrogenedentes bacterium]|nr:HAMP domain-containing protein [Candidatus Hydrogenedentota bacterium]
MLLGFGVAFALLGIVLVWAIANLVSLGRASDAILRENYRSIQAAEKMLQAIGRQDEATREGILGLDVHSMTRFREEEGRFFQSLAEAKDNITIEDETGVLVRLEEEYLGFLEQVGLLVAKESAGQSDVIRAYQETVRPSVERVSQACQDLRTLNEEFMVSASTSAGRLATRAIWSTLAVGLVALVLGVGFSMGFSRRVVRPIGELTQATTRLTEGHYEVRVPSWGGDEIGLLAQGFNVMAEKLGAFHNMNLKRLLAEQRKTEAVLRSISDGTIVLDAEYRIASMNPAAAALFRVDMSDALNRHVLEIVRDRRLFDCVKEQSEWTDSPKVQDEERVFAVEREDEVRYYLYDARPVKADDGSAVGIVLVFRDITRFQELDRMKSDFVMAASHELRTPMTGIEMSLGLLDEKLRHTIPPDQRQLLEAAQEDVARLKALISDLLDLSRLESGRIELQFVRVVLRPLFERVIEIFSGQVRERSIELTCEVPEQVPPVRADPNKIAWVLSNLVSNALRYVRDGGRVGVSAELAGAWIHVHVADNGKGIPEEYHARVFDKFFQVQGGPGTGGTGLGLAISKEIVRAHRGAIWVDSTPGEGSTFTFTLPAWNSESGEEA